MELLSYPLLDESAQAKIEGFLSEVTVVGLTEDSEIVSHPPAAAALAEAAGCHRRCHGSDTWSVAPDQ